MAKKEPVDERNLDGYGAPTIPWNRARERFEEDAGISPTHWLATVRPGWQACAGYFLRKLPAKSGNARKPPCLQQDTAPDRQVRKTDKTSPALLAAARVPAVYE